MKGLRYKIVGPIMRPIVGFYFKSAIRLVIYLSASWHGFRESKCLAWNYFFPEGERIAMKKLIRFLIGVLQKIEKLDRAKFAKELGELFYCINKRPSVKFLAPAQLLEFWSGSG
jgi:hypothetical protein